MTVACSSRKKIALLARGNAYECLLLLSGLYAKKVLCPFCRTKCENLEDTLKNWKESCFMVRIFFVVPRKICSDKSQLLFAYADNRTTCFFFIEIRKKLYSSVADWFKTL